MDLALITGTGFMSIRKVLQLCIFGGDAKTEHEPAGGLGLFFTDMQALGFGLED